MALLVGTGAGLCFPALMALAMSSATPQDAGLASGLVNTTAQIGGALGLAVLATVSASRSNSLIAQHQPAAAALTEGYHLAFWIACGLVVAAAGLAAAVLRPQPSIPPAPAPALSSSSPARPTDRHQREHPPGIQPQADEGYSRHGKRAILGTARLRCQGSAAYNRS